ncbi:MAG: sigma-54-dependent Fis family transcriptional regulator [Myxococcales bacterium]|nr:sigma-54-dependent Fis family transcriptional regulator [Myxococcales bacterium]
MQVVRNALGSQPDLSASADAESAAVVDSATRVRRKPIGPQIGAALPLVPVERGAGDRIGAVRKFGRVLARSSSMQETVGMLERFARTEVTVTLVGETGAGKDVLAHAIHEQSARSRRPFVVFDCGSVAANLAESELLGHERGAFTGAVSAHAGAFERAHGGTLFLDEIAELPLDLQSRLLRALENRRVRRVGGRVDRCVDVRVIAATNRDLKADVTSGKFREDLFFRLAVAVVRVPPLRERPEDLPELVRGLLADLGRAELRLSDAAHNVLRAHPWRGNVRELKNALSCSVAFVEPGVTVLEPHHFRLLARPTATSDPWIDGLPLAGQALETLERAAIRQTLVQSRGNKVHAARSLGIAVSTLYEKLKKHGL